MKLFAEKHISDYFSIIYTKIKSDIDNMIESKFLEYEPEVLAKNKADASKLNHLEIDLQNRETDVEMVNIPAEDFPINYDVRKGKSYPCAKAIFIYSLPKESELLSCSPINFSLKRRIDTKVSNNDMVIEYQTLYGNRDLSEDIILQIQQGMNIVHEEINRAVEAINRDIDNFNKSIEGVILELVESRHEEIKRRKDQNNRLNNF